MSSTQEVGEIFGQGTGPAHAMLRSPTVLIASIGLWGMNVYFFRLFGIDYVKVLKYDLIKLADSEGDTAAKDTVTSPGKSIVSSSSSVGSNNGSINNNTHNRMKRPSVSEIEEELENEEMENDNLMASSGDFDEFFSDYAAITWQKLVFLSVSLLMLLHLTVIWWIDIMDGGFIGAVFCFYGLVTLGILFPLPALRWLRKATVIVLQRSFELLNPRCNCITAPTSPRPIPFVDVFFADAMCSLSKVFFDWGMLFHMASHYPNRVPAATHNIIIPSAFAAVPFLVRARQCIVMYNVCRLRNDSARYSHLWNALKYSTSIFPLCLSAYQKTLSPAQAQKLELYLIVLLVINALYALYWDIVMDWGMMHNAASTATVVCSGRTIAYPLDQPRPPTCGHAVLRPRLRFGVGMSLLILLSDAVLRFSWTLRFYHKLFPSGDAFVLCTQFLEVFRRAMWNLLRVEWENLKQSKVKSASITMTKLGEDDEEVMPLKVGKMQMVEGKLQNPIAVKQRV